jgi:lipoprotein-releasing system ATP-binding protein
MPDENQSKPQLVVRGLRREFPTPREPLVVLDGIDLELERGRSVAVMGPSGSGKSTLLHILGALDRPTSGQVELDGVNPFKLSPAELAEFRNHKVGFIFQDHHLLPQCTVLENVLVPTLVGHNGNGAEIEKRAADLLERVGLSERLDHRPAELSGGERQRVATARSMINKPSLLLCDEPTGNLDRKNAEAIGDLLESLRKEEQMTLVVVTHSAQFAARFDRVFELIDGRIEQADPARPSGASS